MLRGGACRTAGLVPAAKQPIARQYSAPSTFTPPPPPNNRRRQGGWRNMAPARLSAELFFKKYSPIKFIPQIEVGGSLAALDHIGRGSLLWTATPRQPLPAEYQSSQPIEPNDLFLTLHPTSTATPNRQPPPPQAPILFVASTNDKLCPFEQVQAAAALAKRSSIVSRWGRRRGGATQLTCAPSRASSLTLAHHIAPRRFLSHAPPPPSTSLSGT